MSLEILSKGFEQRMNWEIGRYRDVLAGVAETHRWVDAAGDVFDDVHMPEGVTINMDIETEVIEGIAEIRGVSDVIYEGPINAEQALGAIMVRREMIKSEQRPLLNF